MAAAGATIPSATAVANAIVVLLSIEASFEIVSLARPRPF
jgi:hypothetical protein